MNHHVITDYTNVNTENVHLKVYVRLRPPGDGSNAVDPRFIERFPTEPKKLTLRDPGHHYGEYAFMFDQVFWTDTQQEDVFNSVCRPQVDHILNGFNSCCFAYGQTGSGKTHTMFGNAGDMRGLIPRAMEYLCAKVEERRGSSGDTDTAMVVSFLEIYCDQIRDLGKVYLTQQQQQQGNGSPSSPTHFPSSPRHAAPSAPPTPHFTSPRHTHPNSTTHVSTPMGSSSSMAVTRKTSDLFARIQMARHESFARSRSEPGGGSMDVSGTSFRDDYQAMNLEIREDGEGNVFVKDLTLIPVNSEHEVMSVISEGLKLRATHETKLNAVSSRSHTIFSVTVVQRQANGSGEAISGTLHMVDLAGSERLKKSDSQGVRLREAVHINSSLTALGKVVVALDPAAERTHVPYRDAKLTRILQNSIGGNAYTAVVATVHPLMDYSEECLSSLQFANRCRAVTNQPRINYVGVTEADKDKRLKRLTEEVGALNRRLRAMDSKANERMLTLLHSLGHQAVLGADGSIETADGRRIGLVGGELVIQPLQQGGGSHSQAFLGGGMDPEGGRGSIVVARLNALVEELRGELQEAKGKSRERKKKVASLEEELKREKLHVTKLSADLRDKLHHTEDKLHKKSRQLRDYATCLNAQHKETLQRLVDDNQTILRQHMTHPPDTVDNHRVHKALIAKARLAEEHARKEEQQKLHKQLVNLTRGKESQMENLRQQFEAHLRHKDEQLQAFVDDFNRYRAKKRQEGSCLSHELIQLYDYASSLKRVLDRAEAGLYPLREVGPSRHVMEVPRADKPQHQLLVDPAALPVTRRLLSKRQHETLTLQKVQHRATQALCSTAKLNESSAERDMQSILRCYSKTLTQQDLQRHASDAIKKASQDSTTKAAVVPPPSSFSDGGSPLPPPRPPSLLKPTAPNVSLSLDTDSSDSEGEDDESSHARRARAFAADQPWALDNHRHKPRPHSAHPIISQPPPDNKATTTAQGGAGQQRPNTDKATHTLPGRGGDNSRLRPQSAPPQKPSHDTAPFRRSSTLRGTRDSQDGVVVEEPGVWGGDDRSLEEPSRTTQPRGHHTQPLQANGRAIFSDYDEGVHDSDESPAPPLALGQLTDSQPLLVQPPASLVQAAAAAMGGMGIGAGAHYIMPPQAQPQSQQSKSLPPPQQLQQQEGLGQGLGWGQQQTYSAGQQLWGISMQELKHRRESADSFGQVSVSGGSDRDGQQADGSVAGQGQPASIYRDYDDNDNDNENENENGDDAGVDPAAILMGGTGGEEQQQQEEDEGFQDKIDLQGPGIGPYGTHTHPFSSLPAGGASYDTLPAHNATNGQSHMHSHSHTGGIQAPSDAPPRRASPSHAHSHSNRHTMTGAADDEVRRYRAQVREQSRRLLELRCSYEALQRQVARQTDTHTRAPLPTATPHKPKPQHPPSNKSRRQGAGQGAATASEIRASHKVLLQKRPVSATVRPL